MNININKINWLFTMAWRDARPQWGRMILYILSVTIGIGALVAIQTFNATIESSVDQQSKSLLGVDLEIESDFAFPDSLSMQLDTLGQQQSREVRFTSMVLHNESQKTRIAQIRGLDGSFPFYGAFTLESGEQVLNPDKNEAFIDENLALFFQATEGDSVKIGQNWYSVSGIITKIPGESAIASFVGPRIYIEKSTLDGSNLLQRGSRVEYKSFHKIEDEEFISSYTTYLDSAYANIDLDIETVESQKRQLGRALDNLYSFLNLVAFIALLLGAIGVGSSINVLARQKQQTIALLRCIGAKSWEAIGIFVIQALSLGFIGASIGVLIGVSLVPLFPLLVEGLLPFDLEITFSLAALLNGFAIGFIFTLIFVLLPLLPIRKASPLSTLRVTSNISFWKDKLATLLFVILILSMMGFIYAQLGELDETLGFMGGLLAAMGFLTLIAWGIRALFRNVMPKKASFSLRQGLANLYRPNNQTLLMIVSTGLGTFLISTIFLTQDILLNQMNVSAGEDQPNMVLFDVQYDQQDEVERILNDNNLNIESKTPIVTMRLATVNGRSVGELKRDTTSRHDGWVLEREWRVSYRDSLNDAETITEGTFIGRVPSDTALVPVSLSTDLQDDLDVQIGDTLTYDVQGVPIQTTVASFRQVNWQQFSTNFFLIFPEGILENAPQFYVYLAKYTDDEVAAQVKNELVQEVPNVSVIDLSLVLETVRGILDKIQYAVQFMAMFSILTGLVVLISSLIINRDQRVRESVLLRTLGAVKSKIKTIQFVEFTFLGIIASMTGALLSIGSSYALSRFVFQSDFYISWLIVGLTFVGVTGVVVAIGLSNSRGIADRSPLDILREEM